MPQPIPADAVSLELQVGFILPDAEPAVREEIREVIATEARKLGAAVADELERRGVEHVTVTGIDGD